MNPRIPEPGWAVLRALRLDTHEPLFLRESAWDRALDFADRAQLTLALRGRLREGETWERIPDAIRARLDRNLADNTERYRRLRDVAADVAARLTAAGVDFLTLKGLSHSPDFAADPRERVQYDIDLFCPPEAVYRARDVLLEAGYEPLAGQERFPVDHLPTMVRKTGWMWRDNFFDPDLPPSIDLHFRFWDEQTEQLQAPGVEEFWNRRAGRELDLADRLGYAALHTVRHLLRGSLRLYHVYEIARFLRNRTDDSGFWLRWSELHPPELRRLESIALRLAQDLFGSRVPAALPAFSPGVETWFRHYAWSPVEALFHPNKHELLLHLSLLPGGGGKWQVVRRRLFPMRLPGPVEAVHVPADRVTPLLRMKKQVKYAAFLFARLIHHTRVLLPTLWALARWRRKGLFTIPGERLALK